MLARLPIAKHIWLGFGHTMDKQSPFAEGTELCATILTGPQGVKEGGEVCTLPGGEEVNFYQVIPLYRDELKYKLDHDADTLLEKMADVSFVVNPNRRDVLAEKRPKHGKDPEPLQVTALQTASLDMQKQNVC